MGVMISKTSLARLIAAVASGVLYWAAFPPLDRGWLGLVALVPLLRAVRGCRPLGATALGGVAGATAATLLVSPSLRAGMTPFLSQLPWAATALAVLVPALYGGAYVAAFAGCAAALAPRVRATWLRPLAIAAAWSACELLRARLFYGNPWAQLGQTATATPAWVQVADIGGVALVSFVIATVNAAIAAASWRGGVTAALVAAATWGYGVVQLGRHAATDAASLRVVAVQPSVPEEWRYALARTGDTVRRLVDASGDLAVAPPDLVVWPENAVSVDVEANTRVLAQIAPRLPSRTRLLFGAPRAVSGAGVVALRNAALLLDGGGRITGVYDKRRLTPFGEYYPLGLERLLGAAARPAAQYTTGTSPAPLVLDRHGLGVLICLEAVFAEQARDTVLAGADVLVNLANDGWFGPHALAEQHLRAVVLRAVETRRPLIRVDNAGVTAIVDARGVVVARLPRDVPGRLDRWVTPRRDLTWYVRWGDAFGVGCGAIVLGLLFRRRR